MWSWKVTNFVRYVTTDLICELNYFPGALVTFTKVKRTPPAFVKRAIKKVSTPKTEPNKPSAKVYFRNIWILIKKTAVILSFSKCFVHELFYIQRFIVRCFYKQIIITFSSLKMLLLEPHHHSARKKWSLQWIKIEHKVSFSLLTVNWFIWSDPGRLHQLHCGIIFRIFIC